MLTKKGSLEDPNVSLEQEAEAESGLGAAAKNNTFSWVLHDMGHSQNNRQRLLSMFTELG